MDMKTVHRTACRIITTPKSAPPLSYLIRQLRDTVVVYLTSGPPTIHPSQGQGAATPTPHPTKAPGRFDEETDVLIVGSGAGALTASLRATQLGLRSVIIEKEATLGGASAISGGGMWIPCNPVAQAAGIKDSEEAALRYFELAVGEVGPASSVERRRAFVRNGPRMVKFLQQLGFRFHFVNSYPDYYPDMEGAMGSGGGRTLESRVFDTRRLKEWEAKLPPPLAPIAVYTADAALLSRMAASPGAFLHATSKILPLLGRALLGQRPSSMGRALVAQLLYLNLRHNGGDLDLRLETSLSRLLQSTQGEILGAEIQPTTCGSTPQTMTIRATRGVILAAGGFARNRAMRQRFMPAPASTDWTSAPRGDTGDAIREGMRVGAATALLDDAWWGPTIVDPVSRRNLFVLSPRALPHCFIVDASGARFMNEAQSYTDAGHAQYARNNHVKAIPAWLIMDSNHRNKYLLGALFARQKPSPDALANGIIFTAPSLEDLARQIGVDAHGLSETTHRWNEMCRSGTGTDTDFGKGDNAYDRYFGDPASRPNPNMGPVSKPPFYAVAIWPGDLGTKGGLLTDECQRVLDTEARVIPRLFAIGNTAASIMGRTYLGAGSTLGPAMTHGFIAAGVLGGADLA
ncbi:FAD binding domain-containing protein [Aspergillus egyptiacus]|nr:FAD binding domain-containing protein [Aspergillus egyptiacus]